jgi:hypothetical protein
MTTTNESGRGDIEDLLPWHAAGTLSRRDAKRVDDALANDPELARRYALVRDELGETIIVNETLGAPSARALDALFKKIDAEPARKPARSFNIAARLSGVMASLSPRALAWSAVAAALAIVLQAGVITSVVLKDRPAGGYQTASAPTAPADSSYAMVRFAPQATAADITNFLEANKLSVAAGPMAGGLYRVRVAVTALPKDALARTVAKLREDKTVDFIATIE